jgi:hypothetical protein
VPTEDTWQRDATPDLWQAVQGALLDDLSTPVAIATLSEPLKAMNDLMFTKKGKKVCFLSLLSCALACSPIGLACSLIKRGNAL